MNHHMHISCSSHVKTHKSQLIHHPIHKGNSVHIFKGNSNTSILSTFGIKESIKANHLLAQLLAQAAGSRSGDGSKKEAGVHAGSRLGETPLAWARCSLAQKWVGRLRDLSHKTGLGESLSISLRRDWLAWARLSGLATVFLQHPSTNSPKTTHWYIHSSHIITSTTGPRNNSQITWKK